MLSRDILANLVKKQSEKASLWMNRMVVLMISLAATLFTFGNMRSAILDWNYLSMGLRGAGIFLPLSLAVFLPGRVRPKWAIYSMIAGTVVTLAWKGIFPQGIDPLYAGLGASLLVLGCGWQKQNRANCD